MASMRMSVARKVYRYNEADVPKSGPSLRLMTLELVGDGDEMVLVFEEAILCPLSLPLAV